MRNSFSKDELDVLQDYLDLSSNYFEYGSGLTTLAACEHAHLKKIFTVTSEEDVYKEIMQKHINYKNLQIFYKDINAGTMGRPKDNTKKTEWPDYPNAINLYSEDNELWDLVLVNGRFRVACAAAAFDRLSPQGYLLVHDFDRTAYSSINTLYTQEKKIKTLCVFKKKNLSLDLFNKFRYNYE